MSIFPRTNWRKLLMAGCIAAGLAQPLAAQAQDDDGANFLTRTLQNALSGSGRTVKIDGFEGALSSQATMKQMTIADDKGVWLEIDDAKLDWKRSALLLGKVEVTDLSAAKIVLYRLPESEDTGPKVPSAQAKGFSIPKLPVSINVDQISADEVDLGETVLGQSAVLSVNGHLKLAGGGLDTRLDLQRKDQDGHILLSAAYDPDKDTLSVDTEVHEAPGGLVSSMMQLPGTPSVDMTVKGSGPINDFSADLNLQTDGQQRMTGNVTLKGRDDGGLEFALQTGGDLTALAAPDYADFLGNNIKLVATGTRAKDGAINVDLLRFSSASVQLDGTMALDASGAPESFALKGSMAAADGSDRLNLPFGDGISVASAVLQAKYDRKISDKVTGVVDVTAPQTPTMRSDSLKLGIDGTLKPSGKSKLGVIFDAAGLDADDPSITQAVGTHVTGSANVAFGGGPFDVTDLKINSGALALTGSAGYVPGDGSAKISLTGKAAISDLSAFSGLAGMDGLKGKADLDVSLDTELPSTAMHLTAKGNATDLAIGNDKVDPLLTTPVTLDLDVSRNADGITVKTAHIGNNAVEANASGKLGDSDGSIDYSLKLADVGALTGSTAQGGTPAALAIKGAVTQSTSGMRVTAKGGGKDVTLGIPQVDALLAGPISLDVALNVPKDGDARLERAHFGTQELELDASGGISAKAASLTFGATLQNSAIFTGGQAGPLNFTGSVNTLADGTIEAKVNGGGNIGTGIEAIDNLLNGKTTLSADVTSQGGNITVNTAKIDAPGFDLGVAGKVTGGVPDLQLTADLADSAQALGKSAGPVSLKIALTGGDDGSLKAVVTGKGKSMGIGNSSVDALFAGDSDLAATIERTADGTITISDASFASAAIKASADGKIDDKGPDVSFTAKMDNLGRLVSGMSGPLAVDGSVTPDANGALAVNVKADGPAGADATISGTVGHADGSVDLAIKGDAPLGLANAFIAPRSMSGTAGFDLTMKGQPGLEALAGKVTLSKGRVVAPSYGQSLNDIGGTINLSNGTAQINVKASPPAGGTIAVSGSLGLTGQFAANLVTKLQGAVVTQGSFATSKLNGQVTVKGPLMGSGGKISGSIGLSNTEIRLTNTGLSGVQPIPDITHAHEGSDSRQTRSRAGLVKEVSSDGSGGGGSAFNMALDLEIKTDQSIFIRGRGLDAELKGGLRIGGTTSAPAPVGQFDLVRGRLDLLTKQLDLSEGNVTMSGDFVPALYFVATASTGEYTITITIDGDAENPEVTFSSDPELPEDEVVSQLFFGTSTDSLSALQAAQLAAAVATLTGSGSGGIMDKLRSTTGLDDLNVSTNSDGETSVTAGKYLTKKIYSQTEVAEGSTTFSLNLDLTNDVKAKLSAETDGSSGIGLYYDRNY